MRAVTNELVIASPCAHYGTNHLKQTKKAESVVTGSWTRITLGPDAELQLKGTSHRMTPGKRRQLLKLIKQELRKQ